MGSHSVTCHPTEVRIPPLPLAEAGTRFSDPKTKNTNKHKNAAANQFVFLAYFHIDALTQPLRRPQHGDIRIYGDAVAQSNRPLSRHECKPAFITTTQDTSAPEPPPGELEETFASSLIVAYSLHYVKTT